MESEIINLRLEIKHTRTALMFYASNKHTNRKLYGLWKRTYRQLKSQHYIYNLILQFK